MEDKDCDDEVCETCGPPSWFMPLVIVGWVLILGAVVIFQHCELEAEKADHVQTR